LSSERRKEAVGSGDNTGEPLGKVAGIYRVNSDGTIEALESARGEGAGKASMFVTAVDRAGRRATAYLAPDRPARITGRAVATNHQGEVEWVPYAAAIRSVERQQRLEELLADGAGASGVAAACLQPPLYATRFGRGFGTLYTADYRPGEGVVRYRWPDRTMERSLDRFESGDFRVELGVPTAGLPGLGQRPQQVAESSRRAGLAAGGCLHRDVAGLQDRAAGPCRGGDQRVIFGGAQ
jgi:hypothetical protein